MTEPRYHVPERLHADRSRAVIVHGADLPWTPSPLAGVERRFLEREGAEVARATSLVRYAAGSAFSEHLHEKGEEFLVLDGVFSDQGGDFGAGCYVRNPPGSRHAPFTREGCTIFVKLRQMPDDETETQVRATAGAGFEPTAIDGLAQLPLYSRLGRETVALECLRAGTTWPDRVAAGGEEILVLEGDLRYGDTPCAPLTWLRIPPGQEGALSSAGGCRYWVKRGHL